MENGIKNLLASDNEIFNPEKSSKLLRYDLKVTCSYVTCWTNLFLTVKGGGSCCGARQGYWSHSLSEYPTVCPLPASRSVRSFIISLWLAFNLSDIRRTIDETGDDTVSRVILFHVSEMRLKYIPLISCLFFHGVKPDPQYEEEARWEISDFYY